MERFKHQRKGEIVGPQLANPMAPVVLTEALIKEACDLMHVRMLESDEARRLGGLSAQEMESLATVLEVERAQLRQANASGNSWPVETIVPTWLQALGLTVSATDPLRPSLARELVKARLRAIQAILARHSGDLVDTPPEPPTDALEAVQAPAGSTESDSHAEPRGTPRTLRQVYTRWKAAKVRSSDAEEACDRALKLFEGKFGHPISRPALAPRIRTATSVSRCRRPLLRHAKDLGHFVCHAALPTLLPLFYREH